MEAKDCVARIMEGEQLTQEEAEKAVIERDKARAYYFKRFFGADDPRPAPGGKRNRITPEGGTAAYQGRKVQTISPNSYRAFRSHR